ncbi:MAG: hypothetical protein AAGI66_02235 [Cyanobacteria bacterium P01_H01_bin.74]
MDIESKDWDAYEAAFMALVESLTLTKGPVPELSSAKIMLCLYGENGMPPEQEFEMLNLLKQEAEKNTLCATQMMTSYWEDIILYVL